MRGTKYWLAAVSLFNDSLYTYAIEYGDCTNAGQCMLRQQLRMTRQPLPPARRDVYFFLLLVESLESSAV
jgi:hypothetical protein